MLDRRLRFGSLVVAFCLAWLWNGHAGAAASTRFRFLNASPDAPAMDVYLDGAAVGALQGRGFGIISAYLPIAPGTHSIKVYANGGTTVPLIDRNVDLPSGSASTIAATNVLASIEMQLLTDRPSASCSKAQVRVVHLAADLAAVDLRTSGPAPPVLLASNVSYPHATGYLTWPTSSFDLDIVLAGTTTRILLLAGLGITDSCASYSEFIVGSAEQPPAGANPIRIVQAVDQRVAPPTATAPPTDALRASPRQTTGSGPWLIFVFAVVAGAIGAAARDRRVSAQIDVNADHHG